MGDVSEEEVGFFPSWGQFQKPRGEKAATGKRNGIFENCQQTQHSHGYLTF